MNPRFSCPRLIYPASTAAGHESGGRAVVGNHGRERVVTPAGRADRQTLITIDFMTVPFGQASRYALYGMQIGEEALGMGIDGCEWLLCNWRWGDYTPPCLECCRAN